MKIWKVKKLATNLHDEKENVIYIRNFEQALNYGLMLKKLHIVIIFKQKALLKPNSNMKS